MFTCRSSASNSEQRNKVLLAIVEKKKNKTLLVYKFFNPKDLNFSLKILLLFYTN